MHPPFLLTLAGNYVVTQYNEEETNNRKMQSGLW